MGAEETPQSFWSWSAPLLVSLPVLILIWIIYKVLADMRSPLRKIPGPSGSLLLGNLADMRLHCDFLEMVSRWSEEYGGILLFRPLPGRPVVYLSDPELVKHVLITNRHKYLKPTTYKRTIPLLNNSLLTSNGKEHAQWRSRWATAFDHSKLQGMMGAFRRVAQALVENWTDQIRTSPTNHADVMASADLNHYSLDLIGQTALGHKFDTLSAGDTVVSRAFYSLLRGESLGRSVWRTVRRYLPLEENRRRNEATHIVKEIIQKAIRTRRQQNLIGQKTDREQDFLDSFMELADERTGMPLEHDALQAQVLCLFAAGQENVGAMLSWTLYELAKNPDIQAKVREEVIRVFSGVSEVTFSTLGLLEYTGNVLKESLRMHPATHGIGRWSVQEDSLGPYFIPRKTFFVVGIHGVQNSPKYWTEPGSFNPDRFQNLTPEQEAITQSILIPFSAGPRQCIGRDFVMANMKLVLAMLLQCFSVSLVPGLSRVKNNVGVTCQPWPPLKLRVTLVGSQSAEACDGQRIV